MLDQNFGGYPGKQFATGAPAFGEQRFSREEANATCAAHDVMPEQPVKLRLNVLESRSHELLKLLDDLRCRLGFVLRQDPPVAKAVSPGCGTVDSMPCPLEGRINVLIGVILDAQSVVNQIQDRLQF
jgi:hypothetical protein